MTKNYLDFLFGLDDGSTYKLTIKDTVENVNVNDITAFADLLVEKECHRKSKKITSLKKCTKCILEEEVLIEEA